MFWRRCVYEEDHWLWIGYYQLSSHGIFTNYSWCVSTPLSLVHAQLHILSQTYLSYIHLSHTVTSTLSYCSHGTLSIYRAETLLLNTKYVTHIDTLRHKFSCEHHCMFENLIIIVIMNITILLSISIIYMLHLSQHIFKAHGPISEDLLYPVIGGLYNSTTCLYSGGTGSHLQLSNGVSVLYSEGISISLW